MPEPVHPSLDASLLGHLADSIGRAIADNGGGVLVHVVARHDGPDVGILPLDGVAPADVLLGAVAPAEWAVLGMATQGWAWPLGGEPAGRVRAEVVVLVTRDGRVVGRVRQGDEVITEPPASGITLDCLQRALGLPTAPPEAPLPQFLTDRSLDWARLQQLVVGGGWPELGLSAEEAAWFDEGSFSRWVLGRRPALLTLLT